MGPNTSTRVLKARLGPATSPIARPPIIALDSDAAGSTLPNPYNQEGRRRESNEAPNIERREVVSRSVV